MSDHEAYHETKPGSERSFGIVFAIVFAIIGIWPAISGGEIRMWSFIVAIAFLGTGFARPTLLRPLNLLWFKFGLMLGKIIAPITIAILFYVVVTPTGLIMRLLGKDILRLKIDKNSDSYWIERNPTESPMGSMKKQF